MVRVRTNTAAKRRKKRVLKQAKGQFGHRSKRFRQAVRSVIKGLTYAHRDRKVRNREFRSLWIIRINAACREAGTTYSRFIKGLTAANVEIDRKMLSELAITDPKAFQQLVTLSQGGAKPKTKKKTEETAATAA